MTKHILIQQLPPVAQEVANWMASESNRPQNLSQVAVYDADYFDNEITASTVYWRSRPISTFTDPSAATFTIFTNGNVGSQV